MAKSPYQDFISKPEVSFWVPLITSAVLIAGSFFALEARVSLTNQKLDQALSVLAELRLDYRNNLSALNRVESHLCRLDTIHSINCIDGGN